MSKNNEAHFLNSVNPFNALADLHESNANEDFNQLVYMDENNNDVEEDQGGLIDNMNINGASSAVVDEGFNAHNSIIISP